MNNFTCLWYIFVDTGNYLTSAVKPYFMYTVNEKMSKRAKNNAKYLLDILKRI